MDALVDLCPTAESSTGAALVAQPRIEADRRANHATSLSGIRPSEDRKLREMICEALIDSGSLALAAFEDGRISFASPGFLRLLGLSSARSETATSWCRRIHTADRQRVSGLLLEATTSGQTIATDCLLTEPNGGAIRVHLAGRPAGPTSPSVYTLLLHVDVQHRIAPAPPRLPAPVQRAFARRKNEVLDRASDLLVDAWIKTETLAVLAVGLRSPAAGWSAQTRFRAEEALLEQLRPCLRNGDALGRNGDDGLLIAIPNLSGACAAGIVAGRLIETAGRSVVVDGTPVTLDLNIGIALFPVDDQELSGLLAHAGAALELARQSGANRYSLAETSLNVTLHPQAMPWDEGLRAGLVTVDAQHSQLLDCMREISRDVGVCSDLAWMRSSVDRLKQALFADFRVEDEIMKEHPGVASEAHRKEHGRVLRNVEYLNRADPRQSIALSIQFLYEWLPVHIREHDTPLVMSTYRPLW
jgi:hemerythrin-like metal-binding protein